MEKYPNISKEALEAIENFESQFREPIGYVRRRLFVSLYALQPSAREDVLSILGEYCEKLSELLSNEEISVLQKEYREVMRYCVSSRMRIGDTKLMSLDYPIIPYQVVDLCTTIISPASGSNVLLPYSCPEMFAYLSNDCKCDGYVYDMHGYETSSKPLKEWALSQIMSEVFNVDAQIRNYRFNEVKNSLQKQYDYILAFPPIRVNSNWISDELTLLAKDFLKENGEMFCFLPYEFTCNLEWENLRKTIIDACFEIKVITLCTSTYHRREICVIHLKKTRTGNIMLVGGTQLSREINFSFGSTKSEAEYLIEAIERDEGKYVWHGEAKKIEDYDLRPAIYLMKLPVPQEGERLVKMRELVEVIECDNDVSDLDAECEYKVIEPMDLVSDYTHCGIEPEDLLTYSKNVTTSLTCDALLYDVRGKIAKFSHKGEKVGLNSRIIPFRLKNQSIISEEFLLRALTLKETLEQVKSYERGMIVSRLAVMDFLKLAIIIPSIERQEQLVADAKTIWQIQHETIEEKNKRYREMMWLNEAHIRNSKHTLSGDILPIGLGIMRLEKFFVNNPNGIKLSSVIGRKTNQSVGDLLKELLDSVDKISKDIDNLTKTEEGEKEKLNVAMEINSYCDTLTIQYGSLFRVEKRDLDKEVYVCIRRTSFFDLLNNIVDNAVRHGFVEDKNDYTMKFSVEVTDEQMCRIIIKNNGKPMSERALRIYFERGCFAGKTGHTGIGGSEIYDICNKAGGRALQPYNKNGYVVISVELPLVSRD